MKTTKLFRELLDLKRLQLLAKAKLEQGKGTEAGEASRQAATKAKALQPAVKSFMVSNGTYIKHREVSATRSPRYLEQLFDELEAKLTN